MYNSNLLFLIVVWYSFEWLYHNLLTQSAADWHLKFSGLGLCDELFLICLLVQIQMQMCWVYSLGVQLMGCRIICLYKYYQTLFLNGYTNLYFQQLSMRVSLNPILYHLISLVSSILAIDWAYNCTHSGFNFSYMVVKELDHIFTRLLTIWISVQTF